jgi:PEP-CTERM motif
MLVRKFIQITGKKLSPMRKIVFPLTLLASALVLPLTAHADTIDDFVITGNGLDVTFSLPASPPGNESTCPTGIITSCLPGSETAFIVSTLVTTNGVSAMESIDFPTLRFGGGLSLGVVPGRLFGPTLFAPDAANPTFLTGTFDLGAINPKGDPPVLDYSLSITPETTAQTPEPSTLGLFGTGVLGLIGIARKRLGSSSGSAAN